MDGPNSLSRILRFGIFELDVTSRELRRHGQKVRLPDQSFQVLKELLRRPGEVVTREELRQVLWKSDTFVDFKVGTNSAVRKLREALDDSADHPRFIQTVPRVGYRFVGAMAAPIADQARPAPIPITPELDSPATVTSRPQGFIRASARVVPLSAAGLLLLVIAAVGSAAYAGKALRGRSDGEPIRALAVLPLKNSTGEQAVGRTSPPWTSPLATAGIDPKAYGLFLKGLTAGGQQRHEGFTRAVAYFEQAVAIQPEFAQAHAALAIAQLQLLFGGPLSPHQAIPKAEDAARRALELDDTQAQAHIALAQILSLYHWRWDEGDLSLDRAANLQGGRNEISTPITASLVRRGRFAEAIAVAEGARRLDPLSFKTYVDLGVVYRAAGRHQQAIDELRVALDMNPSNNRIHFQLGVTYLAMGRADEAIRRLEIATGTPHGHNARFEAYLGIAYAAAGRAKEARDVLTELERHRQDQYVSSFGIALIHDALGEKERALAALQRAHDERAVEFGQMAQYPPFRAISSEPGFQLAMRHVGLPRRPDR